MHANTNDTLIRNEAPRLAPDWMKPLFYFHHRAPHHLYCFVGATRERTRGPRRFDGDLLDAGTF